jgi:hypothetical protein
MNELRGTNYRRESINSLQEPNYGDMHKWT